MANNYRGYNYGHVGNDEILTHLRPRTPFGMDVREIVDPRVDEPYGNNNRDYNNHGNNNQVQQMYYNNDHDNYGRRDYDHNDRYNRGNYVPQQISYRMDQEELREISVRINLSTTRNVDGVISALERSGRLRCLIAGNVLTVTGYVPSSEFLYAPNEFLNIVRAVSGHSRACIDRRR